jgi:hypothetical protein
VRSLLAWALVLALLPAFAQEHPAEVRRGRVVTIELKGAITKATVETARRAFENVGADSFPAGLVILIDSPGGDGFAAMTLGRMARARKAHIFVRGRCASACTLLLAGGVVRSAADGALGIHHGTITVTRPGGTRAGVDAPREERARAALDFADRQTELYLAEMGMPPALYQSMMVVPNSAMRWLKRSEAIELGLIGVDAQYAAFRANAGEALRGVVPAELVARTLSVQERCLATVASEPFVACYGHVLKEALPQPAVQKSWGPSLSPAIAAPR